MQKKYNIITQYKYTLLGFLVGWWLVGWIDWLIDWLGRLRLQRLRFVGSLADIVRSI